ncbi:hypothetical protein ACNKHR_12480 [Shigella flexneri]
MESGQIYIPFVNWMLYVRGRDRDCQL